MENHPKSEVEEKSSPNWLDLPHDVTVSILQKFEAVEILENVQWVCTQWHSICKDPSFWRTIIFTYVDFHDYLDLSRLFTEAVDRSCGGLIDLHLINCDIDLYLEYATQSCTKIRRLRLVRGCAYDYGLCEAAKMLPLLEDLEISYCKMVSANALDMVGEYCPLLKSLKLSQEPDLLFEDSEAISIAENMVELRHLQLIGNPLSNKGLEAILDSCIHLESLHLRKCFYLDLEECSLGKRCTERIKDFRGQDDYIDDYRFNATTVYDLEVEATSNTFNEYEFDGNIYDYDHEFNSTSYESDDYDGGFRDFLRL